MHGNVLYRCACYTSHVFQYVLHLVVVVIDCHTCIHVRVLLRCFDFVDVICSAKRFRHSVIGVYVLGFLQSVACVHYILVCTRVHLLYCVSIWG